MKKEGKEKEKKMTVAVPGAGGTVGGYVVDFLLSIKYGNGERKHDVITIDRPGTLGHLRKRVEDGQKGLLVVECDLCDENTVSNCLCGSDAFGIGSADAVILLAADLDIRKTYNQLKEINVNVPIKLYRGLAKKLGKVFIHFSSGSIYADDGPYTLDEESRVEGKSGYEYSKIVSEDCLKILASEERMPKLIIVRPSLIYGPRGRFLASGVMVVPPLLQFLLDGLSPRISGGPKTNLVHAEDVARAAVFLLENADKVKSGEVFNVADDTPVGFGEVVGAAVEAYGIEGKFGFPLPPAFLLAPLKPIINTKLFFDIFDAPVDLVWWIIRKKYGIKAAFSARFEKEMAPHFTKDTIFSNEKIKRLGFLFEYPSVHDGMKNVVAWYKENGWIPKQVAPFWKLFGK